MLVRKEISYQTLRKLNQIDGLYGVAAIVVVSTGLLNWFELGKGYDYYASNTLFTIKFSLFIVVGLLSLYPTISYAKTKRKNKQAQPEQLSLHRSGEIRKVIIAELTIMAIIPFLAELMANGLDI